MNLSNRSSKAGRNTSSTPLTYSKKKVLTSESKKLSFNDGNSTLGSSKAENISIQVLQKENEELKAELSYIKSLYKQLCEESPKEKFDERRINLLKSQIIQLERQVSLQSWALNARTDVLIEVEGQLLNIIDHLGSVQSYSDVTSYSKISELLSTVEGTRQYLFKAIEATNPEVITLPSLYMGKFLKSKRNSEIQPEVTLLDVCSGKLEHLSIKQVAKLESKLSKLYKHLILLHQSIQEKDKDLCTAVTMETSKHIGQPIRSHAYTSLETTHQLLYDCCQDLLSLSVLLPTAPWPPLSKPIDNNLTLQDIMAHMPQGLSRRKEDEIRSVIDSLMKAVNYKLHMQAIEIKILKEELSFHQKVYHLQLEYTNTLISSVREAYSEFEKTTVEMLCTPWNEILDKYEALKLTASEEDLREFLKSFKSKADKISDAVECLQSHKDNTETSALSEYGQHFMTALDTLMTDCAIKRDSSMKELLEVEKKSETSKINSNEKT